MERLFIGYTTTDSAKEAATLARGLVAAKLAACVQIEAPITSTYRWEGKIETATEHRLCIKFIERNAAAIERWLCDNHSYDEPEWLAFPVEIVSKGYHQWACAQSN